MKLKARTDEELGNLTNYLSQFNFDIKYNPGKYNVEADCLSRNPIDHTITDNTDIIRTTNTLTLTEIITDQKHNEQASNNITTDDNNIKYKGKTGRIIISQSAADKLIDRVHHSFGHIGSNCMFMTIKKHYYFKNMFNMINNYCKRCATCIKNKTRKPIKLGTMGILGPATKPFEIMSLDTIGGFGGRRSTKKYMHLVVDHFTRYAFISTSRTQTTNDFIHIIKKIKSENNLEIGILLTDQYAGITSKQFQSYLEEENIEMILTAVDCAFSNGLNERLNQTLVNRIRCKINETEKKRSWTTIAQECINDYNNTIHSSTGFAPRYLLYGDSKQIVPAELYKSTNLQEDRNKALQNSTKAHELNEKRYNKQRKDWNFNKGDLVYVEMGNKLNRTKMDEIRQGPFPILNVVSKHIMEIKTGKAGNIQKYHVSKLVPYNT